jgi:uncharacterized 2Fe-2S/4Fe-4S cluster protein (DUF4445 family)
MEHFTVHFLPDRQTVRIHAGATLFEAAGQADIVLVSPCGCQGTCGKCKVLIEPAGIEVLACQFRVTEDLTVTIPQASRYYHPQILLHGREKKITADPCWKKIHLDHIPSSIVEMQETLSSAVNDFVIIPSEFTFSCDPGSGPATAVLHFIRTRQMEGWGLVCIEKSDPRHLYGAAVDIGTTTVVLHLADLQSGKLLATASAANPQHQHGDDVISRIHFASQSRGQEWMQRAIVDCLNVLLVQAAQTAKIKIEQIYELVAVGNTTMNHLLMKFPVFQLGQSPYKPYTVAACDVSAKQIGLKMHPQGNLHTVQNIAGFLGSDTVAAAVAAELGAEQVTTLLVDIGTNGEIMLYHQSRLYAVSCAAGPALEGARIMHGSRAMDGAIQRVVIDSQAGDIDLDVIGNGAPHSICGSGLIDALAVMVQLGVIDSAGGFVDKETLSGKLPSAMLNRVIEYDGQPAFVLAEGQNPILLTQGDVRQLQLAKAAIRAGCRILKKQAGISNLQIEKILLAGAFGNYIQKSSALRIGLLPEVPEERIHFIGNAAGGGGLEILLNRAIRDNCESLARMTGYIELATRADFQDIFTDCLMFE